MDSDLSFIRTQYTRIILVEHDSTMGEWAVGVKEKGTVGERKLEGGVGGVLRTVGAPVRTAGFVRMMWFVRVVRLVGVIRFVWMVRFVGMTRFVGVTRLVRMIRLMWVVRPLWMIRFAGMIRVVRRLRVTRMMRGPGFLRGVGFAVRSLPARVLNLLGLGPLSELVAFQFLVGIKSSLQYLLAFHALSNVERSVPIRNPRGSRWGSHRSRQSRGFEWQAAGGLRDGT